MRQWGSRAHPVLVVMLVAAALPVMVLADDQDVEEKPAEIHEEVVVVGQATGPEQVELDDEELHSGRHTNIGEALTAIPGVSAVRRGASATEPVIRGMGYERVVTQLGHLPLFGACPARMDPPVTYFPAHGTQGVLVARGLASVTLGPAGTGGRIVIDPDRAWTGDEDGFNGWASAGGDSARSGYSAGAGFQGGAGRFDYSGAAESISYGDYESADGIEVPAGQTGWNTRLGFGLEPREGHRWWGTLNRVQEDQVDFPALPMDLQDSVLWAYNTGYRIERPEGSTLRRIEASLGYADIDHLMDNGAKPNRGILEAEAETDSTTVAGHLQADLQLSTGSLLIIGADYQDLSRDGLRRRHVVSSGQSFTDRLWPDATQDDLGAFAELSIRFTEDLDLRAGARLDHVESDARAVGDPSLQGRTVLENYIRFYGEDAGEVARSETLPSANLVLRWAPADGFEAHLGAGLVSRPAGVTERYFAFAPAPGGYQLGNPALDAEKKVELDLGTSWQRPGFRAFLSLFNHSVQDYILQTAIDRQDINGDGTEDTIRGFVNTDARLYGGEAGALISPLDHWSFPCSLAWVRACDRENHRPLPEIPPLEGRAAIRADYGNLHPWWAEVGGRFVNEQTRVDEDFPEDETPGFSVWHLRGGVKLTGWLELRAGIENLFDAEYHEHLTREAMMPVGGLMPGDEIPAPGRGTYLSLRGTF